MRWFAVLTLVLAACSTPQYTVMNADSSSSSTAATAQATSYPDLSKVEPSGESSGDVAVIVAIEDYAFLPDVPGAIGNANAWENYLRKSRGFGEVFVLTDKQAPIEEIKRFTDKAVAAAPSGGQLWFVFIGHGAALKDGSDGALIGMDAQQTIESIGSRSIPRKELLASLEQGRQSKTVVVLDTCFSGRSPGGELLAEGTQPVIAVGNEPQLLGGTVVLSAAGNDEVAGQLPGAQKPAFSYLLLGALRGWADDGDGNVTADEAITWTRQQLRHVKGRQQTPAADGDSSITLASNAAEADPGIATLIKRGGNASSADDPTTGQNNGDGTRIDTNEGVVFTKPGDWGVGPAGMGVIINLTNQYSGNSIVVTRQKVKQAFAAQALGAPAPRFEDEEVEVIRQPAEATYGANTGKESEFKITTKDANMPQQDEHHIRWGTYQNGAAWTVDLVMRDASARDGDYEAFKTFVEGLQFN